MILTEKWRWLPVPVRTSAAVSRRSWRRPVVRSWCVDSRAEKRADCARYIKSTGGATALTCDVTDERQVRLVSGRGTRGFSAESTSCEYAPLSSIRKA